MNMATDTMTEPKYKCTTPDSNSEGWSPCQSAQVTTDAWNGSPKIHMLEFNSVKAEIQVAHTYHPSRQEAEAGDCQFEASLGNFVSK